MEVCKSKIKKKNLYIQKLLYAPALLIAPLHLIIAKDSSKCCLPCELCTIKRQSDLNFLSIYVMFWNNLNNGTLRFKKCAFVYLLFNCIFQQIGKFKLNSLKFARCMLDGWHLNLLPVLFNLFIYVVANMQHLFHWCYILYPVGSWQILESHRELVIELIRYSIL